MSKKRDGRKLPRKTLEDHRFRALELRKEGWEVNDIASFLGFHRGSVSRWFTKHKRGGKKALKERKAPGAKSKLTTKEIRKLLSLLKKPATNFGFETPLWTCPRVKQLLKAEVGKNLSVTTVWRTLTSWELSPQIPERIAFERDEEKVKKWLEEEWPKILNHAKRWQAMLYFQDEAGVSLTPVLGRTWAPKGQTPKVKITGKRGGFCVTSAISPAGRMVFRIEKKKINADVHIEFLQQVLRHHRHRKIIIIEDNAPAHIAKKVEKFVEKNKRRLAIYYLPSYSPDLNPDEKTWKYLKQHKLKNHLAKSVDELRELVRSKMKGIQRKPHIIKSFFHETYVT